MVEIKEALQSPCGLYCGVPAVYLAHTSDDIDFKARLLPMFKKWGAKSIEDIACTGCLSNDVVFPFCQTCSIKDYTQKKDIKGFYRCNDFPC